LGDQPGDLPAGRPDRHFVPLNGIDQILLVGSAQDEPPPKLPPG
jgi:hypothetical protein